ncbi:bifunctional 4-hydroxy-2-oxoglutarate aldolase/2-dehydro-3-deoxy-phosphogluconate aldolase [Nocardioides humilatus]|uniref:2-dehydro-3-deoxy-phosphogluconate aldolase n=1 Tax=Nocardioides humilatus TaxID=2607660 RepID=A0A5B1LLY5_9ACTN|nr:bifunctional 4-hydroxy-2-oxoglutarate aldolase/2-dehydro-3-deoxy-phosphogluconate aldolase [Nocardioides humilatus]KAA1421795.1 bifunctional 4-hydroxy-2-oxoglutarate aldolase/2-dehydro-3-deoxy-phosphogluconate aldolase [Nocardioides humilatus]
MSPDFSDLVPAHRLIPVVSLRSPAEAAPLADALRAAGLTTVEVTLRHEDAFDCLAAMVREEGLVVGAGTVRTADDLAGARALGASFLVSPCLTPGLAFAADDLDIPFVPGVSTATEIQRAVDAGFRTVKLFPAEVLGGAAAVRALSGPFPDVRFMPTGGIDADTAPGYLALAQVVAVGGGWMVPVIA